jgi:SNF2 family DNA or RNA helicase
MINFRKIKQDFSPSLIQDGKQLFDDGAVLSAKVVSMDAGSIRITGQVMGAFENTYECEIELDREESVTTDSNCDCPYNFDCQHLASLIFHLEKHLDEAVVAYSRETDLETCGDICEDTKEDLRRTFQQAQSKEAKRKGREFEKELLAEYKGASKLLGSSPFILPEDHLASDRAEVALILVEPPAESKTTHLHVQIALRLPYRSKPLNIGDVREFVDSVRYREPMQIGGKRYLFTSDSFGEEGCSILAKLLNAVRFDEGNDKPQRCVALDGELLGVMLAEAHERALQRMAVPGCDGEEAGLLAIPHFYKGGLESPLLAGTRHAALSLQLELIESPAPKLFIKPRLSTGQGDVLDMGDVDLLECARPGLIHGQTYYRFGEAIKRKHLRHLDALADAIIPEPLFGTFIENSLPQILRYAQVEGQQLLERFVTLPYVEEVEAWCDINYLDGELEASVGFLYGQIDVPAADARLEVEHVLAFGSDEGIMARDLVAERAIVEDLFQGFTYDTEQGVFSAKTDKKIVEFMTEVVPRNQHRVEFHCPENLLEQFIYDETTFKLSLCESERVDMYTLQLEVDGHLHGVTLDQLWECLSTKKAYIELERKKAQKRRRGSDGSRLQKVLVLDLDVLAPVLQIFDELGVKELSTHAEERPLWSLANLSAEQFDELPIEFSISDKLIALQQQMLGRTTMKPSAVPRTVKATLRSYQREGVQWLERLRRMHLSGVLADDMGLGKTLQAITAITQMKREEPEALSLVVCPTSLTFNWKEEIHKFNPKLKVLLVDGTPAQRKKLLKKVPAHDVVVTSYSLLQKDIESYQEYFFSYAILDEAQHIKNRGTRNAKSVKQIRAAHRLILTGTPIENSMEELWSLFDFLMPGLLSSYDRFVEKYLRNAQTETGRNLEALRDKVAPFILRRMKTDVLDDLPPVSEIVYHCHLSDVQQELYRSYANSAREELSRLVKKEGFDKVQIHVLATLTRLKQICCHPAIFAKDAVSQGDSAKYDMLMELLQGLMEGNHKTVIFSQYTRMLRIMREDLERRGIRFCYLDGASKNRLDIVNRFNDSPDIPIFLVSLKAGGSGLNLVGADTVIHYDMWWNPAVENQATDRVHRLGQKKSVSSYKLVTLGTIEEKILELQNRKKGLVTKVVNCDDEAMSRLTWEEVLELLQA